MQTIDTLIELAQGCVANQVVIFDMKIIDALNFILRRHMYKNCAEFEVCDGDRAYHFHQHHDDK